MPMNKIYPTKQERERIKPSEKKKAGKETPSKETILFIKQFARQYSPGNITC